MFTTTYQKLALIALLTSGPLLSMESPPVLEADSTPAERPKEEVAAEKDLSLARLFNEHLPSTYTWVYSNELLKVCDLPLTSNRDSKHQVKQCVMEFKINEGRFRIIPLVTRERSLEYDQKTTVLIIRHEYVWLPVLQHLADAAKIASANASASPFKTLKKSVSSGIRLIIIQGRAPVDVDSLPAFLKSIKKIYTYCAEESLPCHVVLLMPDHAEEIGNILRNSFHGFRITALDEWDFDITPLLHYLYRINNLPYQTDLANSIDKNLAARIDASLTL